MDLRNQAVKKCITLLILLSYITDCQGLTKTIVGIGNDNNQNKTHAQNRFHPPKSRKKVKTLQLLSGYKAFEPDILSFFFPIPSESANSEEASIGEALLKNSLYNHLVDNYATILLIEYLNNEGLYVNLVNYFNKNSILATIWQRESEPTKAFDLNDIIPDLNSFLKEICLEILKRRLKKMLSGSISVTQLRDYRGWVSKVNRVKHFITNYIQAKPDLYFNADLYHSMYKQDSKILADFVCNAWKDKSFLTAFRMSANPKDKTYLLRLCISTFHAVMFSAKKVFDMLLFSYNKDNITLFNDQAMLTKWYGRSEAKANVLTLACMTAHPRIHQDRKNDMMKYLLDLFLSKPLYHIKSNINPLNIKDSFSGTIHYLANKDSPSFDQLFYLISVPKNIQILHREAALDYLIRVLEDYNVQATPYVGHYEAPSYTKELLTGLKSAVKYKNQKLFKALIRLDVTKKIRNNQVSSEDLLCLAANNQEMVQIIKHAIGS